MSDDNVVPFHPREPEPRHVQPLDILMPSSGCLVHDVLTASNALIDYHEREVLRAGALYRVFGNISADTMIGSVTSRGDLLTVLNHDTGEIEHSWDFPQ
jgi:hypothetical protein